MAMRRKRLAMIRVHPDLAFVFMGDHSLSPRWGLLVSALPTACAVGCSLVPLRG
jgi:hypothetical protein